VTVRGDDGGVMGRSREPRPIGDELADVLRARGWDGRLAAARVVARWPEVVGEAVAAHCQPSRLEADGTLHVVADSAAWATQLSYLQGKLLDRLGTECGPGLVRRIQIRTNEPRPRR
jgi:predicted nucleic acid-binding Zn ribbon protein